MKIAVIHNLPDGGAKRALFDWIKGLSEKHELDLYTYTQENNNNVYASSCLRKHIRVSFLYE